ncbi:MAG: hypothetical protein ACR2OU_09760 [Thermomicrobiales bacterium]
MHTTSQTHRPSPLDEAMIQMLGLLEGRSSGVSATKDLNDLADAMDVPVPFVEGLFLSARRRGLLCAESVGRGKVVWTITSSGEHLLAQYPDLNTHSSAD